MTVILVITGMPYSGKTEAANVAAERGIKVINMGDVVREEARKRGLEGTRETLERLMRELRKTMGMGAVAKLCCERISEEDKLVVIDGARNLEEIGEFNKKGITLLLAIHASPRTRFLRALKRGRKDDVKTWREFVRRDIAELEVGLGNLIALADAMIVNEGTLEDLRQKMNYVLNVVEQLAES